MGELCGTGGGWTRLAYLDMSDSTINCPTISIRTVSSGNCSSVQYPSNGISYSQICGRVVGYQYGTADAVDTHGNNHNNINSYYVDGISITHGSPRQHVWLTGELVNVHVIILFHRHHLLELTTFVSQEMITTMNR